ncbi:YjgN family protein [Rudanella lutea]|uniref:YjgN family protein n=1 Tax=Rudanella lutea TaxID=451374 RepID=UPI00035C6917|nr:DUF898 family protein [Rudanella lutea]
MESYALRNRLRFVGTGADLFGIYLLNMLLSIVTLGLYYPWAKAAVLRYTYANTHLDNSPFQFHGTGKEIFVGFLKAVAVIVGVYAAAIALTFASSLGLKIIGFVAIYAFALALVPIAVHGALRYRMSRSLWRGIHFGYRGDRNELIKMYVLQGLLTVVTFGIYSFWMTQNINRYTIGHIRFGSARMHYTGDGSDYFWLCLKGYVLTILTLGIYGFWWGRDLFAYFVDNLAIENEGEMYQFQSSLTVGSYAGLVIGNILLIVLTLGLGAAWATARTLQTLLDNTLLDERLDTSSLVQTELEYRDATGEDLADMMDIGLI